MTRYVVLLRGVNVGGVTVKMAALKTVLESLGLTQVRTVLASGNALVTSPQPPGELKPVIEEALRTAFGYEAWVHVLAAPQVAAITAAYPFPTDESTHHPYVIFCVDPATLTELGAAAPEVISDGERVQTGDGVLYWEVPRGSTLNSPFSKLTARARYRAVTTTRNLRTLKKLT